MIAILISGSFSLAEIKSNVSWGLDPVCHQFSQSGEAPGWNGRPPALTIRVLL